MIVEVTVVVVTEVIVVSVEVAVELDVTQIATDQFIDTLTDFPTLDMLIDPLLPFAPRRRIPLE